MSEKLSEYRNLVGPGLAVAATGIGAGDMVAAAAAGARFGTIILWAAVFGAVIKYALNLGIARWQLATGETLLEGWGSRLGKPALIVFLIYLLLWSFIVAGALISACGLAAYSLLPALPLEAWAILHSLAALMLVSLGRYGVFEFVMKFFIGLMFILIIACALWVQPDLSSLAPSLVLTHVPRGAASWLLGVIGGVGGSVTLLSYNYWMREKHWEGAAFQRHVTIDLSIAYLLTGCFAIAVMIISAGVNPQFMSGQKMVLAVAARLEEIVGSSGKWIFLLGFWGAVFSSMLGVWQGIPYLFADFMRIFRGEAAEQQDAPPLVKSRYYRYYLIYLAIPPLSLLALQRPVWVIVIYAISGALFMPYLAATLLYMNNRGDWVGALRNRWYHNGLLFIALGIFGYLFAHEITSRIGSLSIF